MEKFKFEFTMDEIDNVLLALSQQPYIKVFELIANIHEQYQKNNSKK